MSFINELLNPRAISDLQKEIHTGEVFALWQHLVMRYDVKEMTNIFQNFSKDVDFRAILLAGQNILDEEIVLLESYMEQLKLALPPRPPKSVNTPGNMEIFRDEWMFRTIYMGIQNFLCEHVRSLLATQNKSIQKLFIQLENKEIKYYMQLSSYGKLKGWLFIPPTYPPNV